MCFVCYFDFEVFCLGNLDLLCVLVVVEWVISVDSVVDMVLVFGVNVFEGWVVLFE